MDSLQYLKNCQIFTPEKVVNQMLDKINYNGVNILNQSIIDNACGDGNFLMEIVKRIIIQANIKGINANGIRQILQSKVFACDIDPEMVSKCIARLNKLTIEEGITCVDWNIKCQDGLYFSDKEKFDFVVGNPPYISYSNLEKKTREELKNNFISCKKGKFDYLYAFIEKGLSMLSEDGKMVMITPINLYKTVYGQELRTLIKPYVSEIIDMANQKVFQKVLTSPVITVFQNNYKKTDMPYSYFVDKKIRMINIQKDTLGEKWEFTKYNNNGKVRFGDHYRVANCVATLANKIFVHNVNKEGTIDIDMEGELLRDAASPKAKKFKQLQKIIFPYTFINNELVRYSEEEMEKKFPKAMTFLKSKKKELENRDLDNNAAWYEYGRSQALKHINQKKLLLSSIITGFVKVYELNHDVIPYSGIYIEPLQNSSLERAKEILQSKRFYKYLLSKGVKVNGQSIRISSKDIAEYRF